MSYQQNDTLQKVITELTTTHLPGKERPLTLAFIALLTGGHILIEDIPGLGKTTLAIALAGSLGLSFGRVQCTSDLLPADITGLTIFREFGNSVGNSGDTLLNYPSPLAPVCRVSMADQGQFPISR